MTTKSQTIAADVAALLRSRNPLLWITTKEEQRTERYLVEAAASAGYIARQWDIAAGVTDSAGNPERNIGSNDPGETLAAIESRCKLMAKVLQSNPDTRETERCIWIMRDLPVWLTGPSGASTQRQLRNLARMLPGIPRQVAQAIVILSPSADVPPELSGHATVIEWPLPDREEIASILDAAIASLPDNIRQSAASNGSRDQAIDAAIGLSGEEAAACYAKSLVQLRRIDPAVIANEKKRTVEREGILEFMSPLPGGMEGVGGLQPLKEWLATRKLAYSPQARAYGLPAPRGIMVFGMSGCGKTMFAKACAAALSAPLVRFDMGGMKSKYVGDSEAKVRRAFKQLEALGKCVVLIDEIEKALAGATQGAADGGVASDALGTLLSWMQDRTSEAFIIATSNDVSKLPPELLRKGRFDELWFVDLPTQIEREAILAATLRQYKRNPMDGLFEVAAACEGFNGAEIASLIPDAMFAAFADNEREISASDLLNAVRNVVPLSDTAKDKIEALRQWAEGKARKASEPETVAPSKPALRALDL